MKKCTKLQKTSFVFDRKKRCAKTGKGKIEIRVHLSHGCDKFFPLCECKPEEFERTIRKVEYQAQAEYYDGIACAMEKLGDTMDILTYNMRLGIENKILQESAPAAQETFLEFFERDTQESTLAPGTKRQRTVTLDALKRYGRIVSFSDLTYGNLVHFDKWLREPYIDDRGDRHRKREIPKSKRTGKAIKTPNRTVQRSEITVHNYHRHLHCIVRKALGLKLLKDDPYIGTNFPRGESNTKIPLDESELRQLRDMELDPCHERVRDLFIFAAYTGLSYIDVMSFDYDSMVVEYNGKQYINDKRGKNMRGYLTPIYKPAYDVLVKYNFDLPVITNEKLNVYLHDIERAGEFKKKITFHLARHTFATMIYNQDVPIATISRMLGHSNIRTTQTYVKTLPTTIYRHSEKLYDKFL